MLKEPLLSEILKRAGRRGAAAHDSRVRCWPVGDDTCLHDAPSSSSPSSPCSADCLHWSLTTRRSVFHNLFGDRQTQARSQLRGCVTGLRRRANTPRTTGDYRGGGGGGGRARVCALRLLCEIQVLETIRLARISLRESVLRESVFAVSFL